MAIYIRMSTNASQPQCGCKPKRRVETERSAERNDEHVPIARFFLSEEAYQNDNDIGDNVIDVPLSTMQKYMSPKSSRSRSGGNFQKYLSGTQGLPWIYVKKVQEASGRTVVDDAWSSVAEESVPCISSSFRKIPKKSCGETQVDAKGKPQATFRWNDAWLFVINSSKCQENDPTLYQIVKTLCTPTSGYHCVGKHGGVDAGYIQHQFEKASHIMMMVSDCGGISEQPPTSLFQSFKSVMSSIVLPSNRYKFLVLGFAFLMTGVKMPKPDPMLLCNAMYYGLREHIGNGGRNLYVDIICSRFSVAQHMMREILMPASENKISEMVFGRKGATFLCSLRAVPSVYTYYASMYGFTRTADNRSVYPIFFVDTDDIRAGRKDLVFDPPMGEDVSNDDLIRAIFGESDTETDVIWKAPPGCSLYRIYRLEAPFRKFLKANKMVDQPLKRSKFFPSVQVFHGDNGSNGYYFSKWVSKK